MLMDFTKGQVIKGYILFMALLIPLGVVDVDNASKDNFINKDSVLSVGNLRPDVVLFGEASRYIK